jgi:hypothetical protein
LSVLAFSKIDREGKYQADPQKRTHHELPSAAFKNVDFFASQRHYHRKYVRRFDQTENHQLCFFFISHQHMAGSKTKVEYSRVEGSETYALKSYFELPQKMFCVFALAHVNDELACKHEKQKAP